MITAAIPTYNRPQMLEELLQAIYRQTHQVDHIVVIDNGSTTVKTQDIIEKYRNKAIPFSVVTLKENGGAAGGFHVAVREALKTTPDFIWLFDDDTEPNDDCLEGLLKWVKKYPDAAAFSPRKNESDGQLMLLPRGKYTGFCKPIPKEMYDEEIVEIDYSSYAGMLVRTSAIAKAGLPKAEMYMWIDDVEWSLRLGKVGQMFLVPSVSLQHKEDIYIPVQSGIIGVIKLLARPIPSDQLWKYLCGFRNMTWVRKTYSNKRPFGLYFLVTLARIILFNPNKVKRAKCFYHMAKQGSSGKFDNLTAAQWQQVLKQKDPIKSFKHESRPGAIL